ncbi:1-acyl-sn-glycerol-3-phosphate acyltransferase [Gloeothece citriformis PCC 7424]|uniref:1-acyl-sn-glycerol-3-phosphate acyltransferase n=1 Tax=Gloeothece citriformis (strain PCC 7424) TaxID=65393 RepID=B7KDA4_GLOC7|nr:lysophospholipid acyltransferase family protein [Gloeothece citriformis]ACK68924.1 1-acyl-sn-glycerol-3-phosphate acyltransferase [Gloeothece citriformis PCC 7424]
MTTHHPQKNRESLSSLVLYHLFKWSVVSPLLHTYFQGRIYGAEKVPQQGSLVIVSNHASYFDPPLISCAVRRPVAYMAKEELFKTPVFKQAIQLYGAYPVKRGTGDRGAFRAAVKALNDGWAVGIFLEGTRTPNGRINDPKLGAAMIAAHTQVPLLPVSLWGTEKILRKGSPLPRPTPVKIRIGDLIEPPSSTKREALLKVTDQCAQIINEMHDLS